MKKTKKKTSFERHKNPFNLNNNNIVQLVDERERKREQVWNFIVSDVPLLLFLLFKIRPTLSSYCLHENLLHFSVRSTLHEKAFIYHQTIEKRGRFPLALSIYCCSTTRNDCELNSELNSFPGFLNNMKRAREEMLLH